MDLTVVLPASIGTLDHRNEIRWMLNSAGSAYVLGLVVQFWQPIGERGHFRFHFVVKLEPGGEMSRDISTTMTSIK